MQNTGGTMTFSRRDFLATAAMGSASLMTLDVEAQITKTVDHQVAKTEQQKGGAWKKPVIISAANGFNFIDAGYERLRRGGDTLDAINEVIRGPEDDPNDDSVGFGGLPNEEGVVELDSCCMHGPSRRAGAVAGVHNIKNVSLLAKTVMEHTGHVMLVGEGAERFAVAHGFSKENLLTERSRKTWMLWKETMSNSDWWGPGLADPNFKFPDEQTSAEWQEQHMKKMEELAAEIGIQPEFRVAAIKRVLNPPTGTINCSALSEKGEMSSATTTSGLAWKIPGRAGDSPIIGAGCYCDQEIGAAGATGNGEENIKIVGAHTIVENMRHGMSPVDAGMDALKRIARNYNNDMKKLRYLNMIYYILRKDGAYAGVTLWSGPAERRRKFAVHDGEKRLEECAFLFEGTALGWPPMPARKR
ncbi:MAG TPA: N(4)-(beta-N-acetylglucosaminyl)-L-asparaginase [Clostridia bacterium]|nr:N(4)-(beta-N-acetylglucosaminyl)-L-asparaginase [Clostridia bacterium]